MTLRKMEDTGIWRSDHWIVFSREFSLGLAIGLSQDRQRYDLHTNTDRHIFHYNINKAIFTNSLFLPNNMYGHRYPEITDESRANIDFLCRTRHYTTYKTY